MESGDGGRGDGSWAYKGNDPLEVAGKRWGTEWDWGLPFPTPIYPMSILKKQGNTPRFPLWEIRFEARASS